MKILLWALLFVKNKFTNIILNNTSSKFDNLHINQGTDRNILTCYVTNVLYGIIFL